ncbi:ADP-ribosylglycohydrolase family protein [Tahibacter amnicola]|uniref:ADP-ribosylglycohydrolase family protein n=1 Tax=Tahibacter amnicola TaxID=2976241 RepID=A0ABY6BGI7_9GAMM|nr:ADP-ribosylglycohydrolase family protein [Tahibacter amnicola]UXI68874.1 ADP-ribosylglycohydrolase family protein [Tahibacter amnicola]
MTSSTPYSTIRHWHRRTRTLARKPLRPRTPQGRLQATHGGLRAACVAGKRMGSFRLLLGRVLAREGDLYAAITVCPCRVHADLFGDNDHAMYPLAPHATGETCLLVEIAIGDAYGAGFEFCARERIVQHNTLAAYASHALGSEAGRYTDDTQMSIAVAEVLLSEPAPGSDAFAEAFVRCYRRDPRNGYAKGLQGLLDECADGAALRQRIRPASRRNGAAMRSVPLGLISDKTQLAQTARAQAVVTHDTPEGVTSAHVVALMAHSLLYDGVELADLSAQVKHHTGFQLRNDWAAEVECDAIQTLHAVNTALQRNRRLSDLLRDCVDFGGDVDSVAAIAVGIASLSPEYQSDLPARLVDGLEDGMYGRTFLARFDVELGGRFPALAGCFAPSLVPEGNSIWR